MWGRLAEIASAAAETRVIAAQNGLASVLADLGKQDGHGSDHVIHARAARQVA